MEGGGSIWFGARTEYVRAFSLRSAWECVPSSQLRCKIQLGIRTPSSKKAEPTSFRTTSKPNFHQLNLRI